MKQLFSCGVCPDRSTCKKSCAWLRYELSKVTKRQKEKPIAIDDRCLTNKYPSIPTTSEIIFTLFFIDRKSQKEIAETLYKSQQYISKCIKKHKQILLQNLSK